MMAPASIFPQVSRLHSPLQSAIAWGVDTPPRSTDAPRTPFASGSRRHPTTAHLNRDAAGPVSSHESCRIGRKSSPPRRPSAARCELTTLRGRLASPGRRPRNLSLSHEAAPETFPTVSFAFRIGFARLSKTALGLVDPNQFDNHRPAHQRLRPSERGHQ